MPAPSKEKGLAGLLLLPKSKGKPSFGAGGDTEEPAEDSGPSPELVSAVAALRSALSGMDSDEEAAQAFQKAVDLCL